MKRLPALLLILAFSVPLSARSQVRIVDNVYHLTDQDFDEFISQNKVVLVDFWAAWCGPCREQAPVIDELALEAGADVRIAKMDVDKSRLTPARYQVRLIPTLILFKDGKLIGRFVGLTEKEVLKDAISKAQ